MTGARYRPGSATGIGHLEGFPWRPRGGLGLSPDRPTTPSILPTSALRSPRDSLARIGALMGSGLPVGTVTFLFTDIEGSTRLLQKLGDGYRAVQDEHAAILAAVFTSMPR